MTKPSAHSARRTTPSAENPGASTDLRITEPVPTAARIVADGLQTISLTLLGGVGVGFLIGLAGWITLEEGFPDVWWDAGLDRVSRTSAGYTMALFAGAAVLSAITASASRLLLGRHLAALAGTHPEQVPIRALRTRLLDLDPVTPLVGLCISLLVGAGIGSLVVAPILIGESHEVASGLAVLAVSVLVALLAAVTIAQLRGRGRRAWKDLTALPRQTWSTDVVAAANQADRRIRADRRGRPSPTPRVDLGRAHSLARRVQKPLTGGGAWLLGAGAVVGFIAIFIRQPGKNADTRYYDAAGETAIDVITTAGAVLALAGAVTLLLALLAAAIVMTRERSMLRMLARADDAATRWPGGPILERALDGPSAPTGGGVLMIGSATAVASTMIALLHVTQDAGHPLSASRTSIEVAAWVVVAIAILGAALVFVGIPVGARFRRMLRETWRLGDDLEPGGTAKKSRP